LLILFERYLDRIRALRNEAEALPLMRAIADEFGYRQVAIMEYVQPAKGEKVMLDTHPGRRDWYEHQHEESLAANPEDVQKKFETDPIVLLDRSRLVGRPPEIIAWIERIDLAEVTVVPVRDDTSLVGTVGYSGIVELTPMRSTALQMISINLFAHLRSLRNMAIRPLHGALTAREKEVMALSAEGLTSAEIAERLGMSPRTVNQHVDNVAEKLGTRNRAHTVAEVVRHGLLH
jgi:DNA-binding CsgD family transcriptional regulator